MTGGADKTAQTWDLGRGTEVDHFVGHFARVVDVTVGPRRGQFVGTASADGTARIWDVAPEGGALKSILTGHTNQLYSITFSPRGLYVLTASRDGSARVWKTVRGTTVAVLAGHDGPSAGRPSTEAGGVSSRTARTGPRGSGIRKWPPSSGSSTTRAFLDRTCSRKGGAFRVTTDEPGLARIWRQGLPESRYRSEMFAP